MAYSLAMYQAVSIIMFIAAKMKENMYEYLTTKAISESLGIAVPTAVKILNSLNAAGLTITKEGAKGGIMLAKDPADITLLDIFMVLEQGRPLFKSEFNFNINNQEVEILKKRVQSCFLDAENSMKESLGRYTIEELMK